MEEISWASTRTKYTALFGAPPQPLDDNDIGTVFRQHPFDVIRELERIAADHAKGKLHSPWRIIAKKLDRIAGDHDHIDISNDLRIRQAEAWIRNAGIYCPPDDPDADPLTSREVIAELFSTTGGGKNRSGGLLVGLEAELGERMLALWRAERPRAVDADAAMLERSRPYRDQAAAAKEPAAA